MGEPPATAAVGVGVGVGVEGELAHLRALHRISVALHRGASPADLYEEAVDAVVSVVGVDRASLLLFDPDGVMRFKAWRGLSEQYRLAVEGHTPWEPDEADARPISIPDVATDPELASLVPVFRAEGIGAIAFVPLLKRGGVVGKFMLYYDSPHVFSSTEVATAEILAAHVALALERRAAEEALRSARTEAETVAARLAALARVTGELSEAASVDEVAAVVLGTARAELGADTGSLCLLRGDQLEMAYAVGYPEAVLGRWGSFPIDADLPASEAVRSNKAVFIRSPEERDTRYPIFATTPVIGSSALAIIPLGRDQPFGCLVVGFAEARSLDRADESFFSELAARCSAALVRARLYDEGEQARMAAERAGARLSLLARVSTALSRSLDYDSTADEVAELLVAQAADGCAVVLFEDRRPRVVALRHCRRDRLEALRATAERLAAQAAGGVRPSVDADAGRSLVRLLRVRGAAVGTLVLVRDGPFEEELDGLADEVAARLASAIDNGQLFKERTRIAQTLQASLLPPELPDISGLEFAARHVAAGSGVEVGGDFYDVFRLDARRVVVVLGDVCGRGIGAASLAALCRHTIRSAAVTASDPGAILAHVNEVLLRQAADAYEPRFCTAVVGVAAMQQEGVVVDLALGGHPPPVVRRASGAVERIGVPGFLLGVSVGGSATVTRLVLAAGDALVCVTDGVLERRRPGTVFGDDGLAAAVSAAPSHAAGALAASVEAAVRSFSEKEAGDDLAVLVIRATEHAPWPSRPNVPAAGATPR